MTDVATRPAIAAIIVSHNRREYLRRSVASLRDQTIAIGAREILVVLNGCTDGSHAALDAEFGDVPGLRLIDEPKLGACIARNRALADVRAPLVAYLDDDAIAPPDWLSETVRAFERHGPRTASLGGPVVPIWERPRPAWVPPALDTFLTIVDFGPSARVLGPYQYVVGANMAFRVEPLREAGAFPPDLDRMGTLLLSNGDIMAQDALRQRGYDVVYDPRLPVRHHVAANRLNPEWFWDRGYWQGYSDALMSLRLHGRRPWSRTRRVFWALRRIAERPAALWSLLGGPQADRVEAQFRGRHLVGFLRASLRDRWTPTDGGSGG